MERTDTPAEQPVKLPPSTSMQLAIIGVLGVAFMSAAAILMFTRLLGLWGSSAE